MAITVNSALKRQAVVAQSLVALTRILSPLLAFSRSYSEVPLLGTNKIAVPYIPLETAASTDWVANDGYVAGNATVAAREITVDKRKYQSLGNDSETNSRQPFTMTDELIQQKVEKLGYDVLTDIMSLITATNYGSFTTITGVAATDVITRTAHGLTTADRVDIISITGGAGITAGDVTYAIRLTDDTFKLATTAADALAGTAINFTTDITAGTFSAAAYTGAASGFNVAGIGKLRKAAVRNNWPESNRSLILNADYDQYAMQDSAVITAQAYGSPDAIREGRVPRVLGFDYYGGRYVPANSQALGGFIAAPSAILFACAPIAPTPAVLARLSAYEQFSIPELGIVLTYREFADPQKDTDQTIIECSYGYAVGEAAALQRISQ